MDRIGVAVGGGGVWLVCPAPPGPSPWTPSQSPPWQGEGERFAGEGMIVVDKGVAAVRQDLVVWLVGQV